MLITATIVIIMIVIIITSLIQRNHLVCFLMKTSFVGPDPPSSSLYHD